MQYNIYTEDLKPRKLEKLVSKYFEGFNIQKITGYWKGIKEKSVLISIVVDKKQDSRISKLAAEIKQLLNQEAILVQRINNNNWLV